MVIAKRNAMRGRRPGRDRRSARWCPETHEGCSTHFRRLVASASYEREEIICTLAHLRARLSTSLCCASLSVAGMVPPSPFPPLSLSLSFPFLPLCVALSLSLSLSLSSLSPSPSLALSLSLSIRSACPLTFSPSRLRAQQNQKECGLALGRRQSRRPPVVRQIGAVMLHSVYPLQPTAGPAAQVQARARRAASPSPAHSYSY